MKIFTLDRLGLVKTIDFNEKTAKPAPSKKLLKKVKSSESAVEVDKVERLSLEEFVKENIKKIFLKSEKELIFVTVLNRVFTLDLNSGKCACIASKTIEDGMPKQDLMATYAQGVLITCTPTGIVSVFDMSHSADAPRITQISLNQDKLGSICIHPQFPHIFATGGDERDLCVWDTTTYCQESKSIEPIWKAKNVPNDSLDMRVRVNVTCITWTNKDNYSDIAIGTAYSQVRVYNTKKQKRPILDFNKCGSHPLKSLVLTRNNEFVFSDTIGNVSAIDASSGQISGRFKGIAGMVVDLYACKHNPYLVTVSLDRRLRVFEEKGQRRIVKDIYLKQQLVNVIVDESKDPGEESEEDQEYNEEAEETLWSKLPSVGEKTGEKRKSDLS